MNAEQEQNLLQNLTERSNHVIDWFDSAVKGTGNFLSEQTPLVISEYLTYNFWMSFGTFILFLVAFLVILTTGIIILKKKPWYSNAWNFSTPTKDYFPSYIAGGLIIATSFFMTIGVFTNLEWIKIKVAPRVYMIEKAAELVKTLKQ